jgi:hypothetical protein
MGLNLDAIRARLNQMSGNRTKRIKIVDDKQYRFRIIAFPDNDGQPFKERLVYSIGREWNLLAPGQFGRPDPIKDLTDQLRSRDGKSEVQAQEDWQLAKGLFPKVKHHAIVIDRDNEDAGPQIWTFTQSVAKRLYNIFLDEEYGDITDIDRGTDIKVKRTKADNGFREYAIDPARRDSPLHRDADVVDKWTSNPPDIDSMYKEKSFDELESILRAFLEGDDADTGSSMGIERGGNTTSSSTQEETSSSEATTSFDDIDDAFSELMGDD